MAISNLTPHLLRISLLASAFAVLPFTANGNELNGYMMSIRANAPGIEYLRAGDYRRAIAASRSVLAEPGWQAAAYNNTCVAYTILQDYKRARHACGKAVKILRAAKARQRGARDGIPAGLAMAYSNRGVLRALTGDLQKAQEDFSRAQKYATRADQYTHNSTLLQWNLSINGLATRTGAH